MPNSRSHRPDGTPRSVSPRRGKARKLVQGVNDLDTLRPDLSMELQNSDPKKLTPGSTKKVTWKCPKGHVYQMAVSGRNRGRSCSVCSGRKIEEGFNDLASQFPNIASQAYGWDPKSVTPFSNRKLDWKCKDGHIWKAVVGMRTKQNQGCPVCSNHKILAGFNDIKTTHPEIANELLNISASKIGSGSNRVVTWQCAYGHTWKESPSQRRGRPCPSCNPRHGVLQIGTNDLKSSHPDIALQAFGWDPSIVISSSTKRFTWKCELGHIWKTSVRRRVRLGRGCHICSNQKVQVGFNDFAFTHPELAKMAFQWDPTSLVAGTGKKRTFKCPKGHIFTMSVNALVSGHGCNVCTNKVVVPGINDLATLDPALALQAWGWDPMSIVPGSHISKAWKCELGHIWNAQVKSRQVSGCPYCSHRRVFTGFNDLETLYPDIARESFGWDPSRVLFATTARKRWRCLEGHEWTSTVKNRTQSKRGCPSCAQTGFDPNKDGWLYLIKHERWEMHQIGITNFPDKRLATHYKLGWELLDIRGPMKGELAAIWETEIIRFIKSRGARFDEGKEYGKFTGFTESWKSDSFTVNKLMELIETIRSED